MLLQERLITRLELLLAIEVFFSAIGQVYRRVGQIFLHILALLRRDILNSVPLPLLFRV